MTDAAARLFAAEGYAGTTMEAVAHAAGVSVQGLYFAFQTKANLLRAAVDAATPEDRSHAGESDPGRLLVLLVEDAAAGLDATGALALAVASAPSSDEAAVEVHRRLEAARSRRATELVQRLRAVRPLAPGVTPRRVSDVVFALVSPQLHQVLVRDRGWTSKRYAGWVADAIGRALWG